MNWKDFGDKFKSATGVSLAAGLVLLATYGKQLVDAVVALPEMYRAFAAVLPFGAWSAILGFSLAAGFHTFARSWHQRSLGIEIATIMIGITVTTIQLSSRTPADIISALLVGGGAGLGGLFLSKLLRSIFTRNNNESRPDQTIPESD